MARALTWRRDFLFKRSCWWMTLMTLIGGVLVDDPYDLNWRGRDES